MARIRPGSPVLGSRRGLYLPQGWDENWAAKLAAAPASKPVLAFVGDSITRGFWASSLRDTGYVGLVRADLQAAYGDGGTGFVGAGIADIVQTTAVPNSWDKIVCSAGVTQYTGSAKNDAPGVTILQTTAASGSDQTFTVQGKGDTIAVWCLQNGGLGQITYTVDGGPVQGPFVTAGTPLSPVKVGQTSGWGPGSHTVIVKVAAGQPLVYFCGVSFENAAGVVVNNFSLGGMASGAFAIPAQGVADPAKWNGGPSYPADLVVYALGVNDTINAVAVETFTTNVLNFLRTVRDSGAPKNGRTDVMLLVPHVGSRDSATAPQYASQALRLRGVAEAYGAALVDIWTLARNSYAEWQALGYWGTAANPGAAGNETIHLSNAGHAFVASILRPLITA